MEGYMTIKQAAEKWDVTPRRIQFLCSKGRIKGATKFGRDWAIPVDAKKPEDKRWPLYYSENKYFLMQEKILAIISCV